MYECCYDESEPVTFYYKADDGYGDKVVGQMTCCENCKMRHLEEGTLLVDIEDAMDYLTRFW